jgi:hypothetical protein
MIYVSHALPVNEPGQPRVTRDDLWHARLVHPDPYRRKGAL